MKPNINIRFLLYIFISYFLVSSCSQGHVSTWVNTQAPISRYNYVELKTATSSSTVQIPKEILLQIDKHLRSKFESKHLLTTNEKQNTNQTLIAKVEVLKYVGCEIISLPVSEISGPLRKSSCSLRARLADKISGKIVAEIITTKDAPGCVIGQHRHQILFEELAVDVANEVEKILY